MLHVKKQIQNERRVIGTTNNKEYAKKRRNRSTRGRCSSKNYYEQSLNSDHKRTLTSVEQSNVKIGKVNQGKYLRVKNFLSGYQKPTTARTSLKESKSLINSSFTSRPTPSNSKAPNYPLNPLSTNQSQKVTFEEPCKTQKVETEEISITNKYRQRKALLGLSGNF